MAYEMLIVNQLACMLKLHIPTDRSQLTPPNGSPDAWMNDMRRNTETNYKNLPQTPPILKESPIPTTCEMLIINQLAYMLDQHVPTDRSQLTPLNESLDAWMNDIRKNTETNYKNLPQTPFILKEPPTLMACEILSGNQLTCTPNQHVLTDRSHFTPPNGPPVHSTPNHTTLFKITQNQH